MTLISLPKNLKLPFLYDEKEIDLSNYTPMLLNNNTNLVVETAGGIFKPKSFQDIVEGLANYSCVFTYNPPGENDSLLKFLTDDQLCELNLFGKVEVDSIEIRRMKSNLVINRTPIFNLIGLTKTYNDTSTLESITTLIQSIIESRKDFGVFGLSSGAAEARALLTQFDELKDEISLSHRLKIDKLDKINSACYGGRMESSGLGTVFQLHYDMVKAHLKILADYPGIRDTTWVQGGSSSVYFDKALPTSVYLIKTEIPRKFKYNPLPVRTESGIKYPHGMIIGWYFKDYLLLLQFLNIPFRIIDSIQFLGKGTYPFKPFTSFINGVIKIFEADFPDLECKHLYSTIAGSCKSIYRNITPELSETQVAGRTFNPLIYGFVLSRQNTEIYKQALLSNADAIKMDAIASGVPIILDGQYEYKLKASGLTTFLTPALKSAPKGKSLYRNCIKRDQDLSHIIIEVNTWNSLPNYIGDSLGSLSTTSTVGLGQKFKRIIIIKPHYGNRRGKPIKRVGELLEAWLMSSPSDVSNQENFGLLKLEEYKERFG